MKRIAPPPAPPGTASGGGALPDAAAPPHPFEPHIDWSLPAVARLLACIHALQVRRQPAQRCTMRIVF